MTRLRALVVRVLDKACRRLDDGTGWTLDWKIHDNEVSQLADDIARELLEEGAALSYDDAIHTLAREVVASADDDDNDHPDNVVGRDDHALRVLIEGKLADDIASAVAKLRGKT